MTTEQLELTEEAQRVIWLREILSSPNLDDLVDNDPYLLDELDQYTNNCQLDKLFLPTDGKSHGASQKQLEVAQKFWEGHRFVACGGANRSGKTRAIGAMCFCRHLRERAKKGDVYWVIAQDANTMRAVPQRLIWESLPRWMFPRNRAYSEALGFGKQDAMRINIDDRNSCVVYFKTEEMSMDKFESESVTGVWWTEAESEAIFYALMPRLIDQRGFMLIDYLPTRAWHKYRIRKNRRFFYQHFAMKDNAHNLPEGEIDQLRNELSEREARVRIDGYEASFFGAVYREFNPQKHIVEPFNIPARWPKWCAIDYGHRNPNATVCAAISEDEVLYVFAEHHKVEQTVKTNVREIRAMLDRYGGIESFRGGAALLDPTAWNRTQSTKEKQDRISDRFEEEGFPVVPGTRASTVGEHAMVAAVQRWFEAGKIKMFSTCEETIREHEMWRYKENKEHEAPGHEPFEDKDNHSCDALKLIIAENPTYHCGTGGRVVDFDVA